MLLELGTMRLYSEDNSFYAARQLNQSKCLDHKVANRNTFTRTVMSNTMAERECGSKEQNMAKQTIYGVIYKAAVTNYVRNEVKRARHKMAK